MLRSHGRPAIQGPLLTTVEAARLAARFRLLADPTRLRLLSMMATNDETCVCDLVAVLGVTQPTVSHHVALLRSAGLVEGEARGSWTYYRLTDTARELLDDALGPPGA